MKPKVSIVVPTYNRSALLRTTLTRLAAQELPTTEFEVIVSDDGSTDDTAVVARQLSRHLCIRYTFQEDLGFRAAAARNAGARLASAPTLVFLDTGVVPGPDFVGAHLREAERGRAVVGYTYGAQPQQAVPELAKDLTDLPPRQVRDRYASESAFWDHRHLTSGSPDFAMGRRKIPWMHFWSLNISLTADDFWSVGGFDEDFDGWGMEDLELGYRLFTRGVAFSASREAWAIEYPHERDSDTNVDSSRNNALRLLLKHREPVLELAWAWFADGFTWSLEREYGALLDWTAQARGLRVDDEVEAALREVRPGGTVAVFGCGRLPQPALADYLRFDFDREQLGPATGAQQGSGSHAIGIRTALTDQSLDLVVITSRMRGLLTRHGDRIHTEARRIGRAVWAPPG